MAQIAYNAPSMTIAELELAIARGVGWVDSNDTTIGSGPTAKIDQAITAAGLAAATWNGMDWWWLHSTGSFPTVANTASYALRTVNTNDMATLWRVDKVYYDDDHEIVQLPYLEYQEWYRLDRPTASTQPPEECGITGEPPYIWLRPVPDDAYTVYVDYTRRHSKITLAGSTDAALIVPAEYQMDIYVAGAEWLLRHERFGPETLMQCPGFRHGIEQMGLGDPTRKPRLCKPDNLERF